MLFVYTWGVEGGGGVSREKASGFSFSFLLSPSRFLTHTTDDESRQQSHSNDQTPRTITNHYNIQAAGLGDARGAAGEAGGDGADVSQGDL